ncbi:hypothetical protein FEF26_14995 [Nesterenkonia salmonea]|uniref:DUF4175 domain-containing protein n=1 Tax=Nesterenkonia salmonea TaxID=1804987 RepID=A0A5R9B6T0_9MICC|nr:hypothetical protein [Nesterenkonia salmonea]TLP92225.1 hypothetical protein FEF26_14995 [Nesterenkonia salmonea]
MTVPLVMIIGGAAIGIFFLWYTRVKVDAWWYGTLTGDIYVHLVPAAGMLTAIVGVFELLQELGVEPSRVFFGVPFLLVLAWFMISVVTVLFALPKIPFLLPRWIRERRREEKRLARE